MSRSTLNLFAAGGTRDADMTEAEFRKLLFSQARDRPGLIVHTGWDLHYHTYRSFKSPTGFPDDVLVRPRDRRVVFVETKTEKGKPSDDQRVWLAKLAAAGAETYLWRPSDLSCGEIPKVLAHRGRPPAPCECGRVFVHRRDCIRQPA